MTDDTPAQTPKMSPGLRIVFGLSLALNLLVVAAIAGAWWRGGPQMRDLETRAHIGRVLYKELPREDRQVLRQELRAKVDRSVLRETRIGDALFEALNAEPFDADAVRDLMDRQARALQTGQNAMRDAWIEVLIQMSPEERSAYATRLREGMKHRKAPSE